MAFSWVLGRRRNYLEDRVEGEAWPPSQAKVGREEQSHDGPINLADIKLSIEDGLVMAFGPLGDPIPPQLLKEACARQPRAAIRLPNGTAVDHGRLIAVIEAQQSGGLAEHPTDPWIESLLGAGGEFEPVSAACLAREEVEDKSVVAGRLALTIPGSETITLRDAHPGSAGSFIPARLTVDGRPVSIADAFGGSGQLALGESVPSISPPAMSVHGDDVTLRLDDRVEARLEAASPIWDGEAKVALCLEDGRPVSIDDLAALLREASSYTPPEAPAPAPATYALFGGDDPDLRLSHATIATVSNVPEGWSLTTGKLSKQGAWILDPSKLDEAAVRVAGPNPGPQSLMVKVMSVAEHDGGLDHQTRTVVIPPGSMDDPQPSSAVPADEVDKDSSIPIRLIIDDASLSLVANADAVLLRGISEENSLSRGVFDPSVNGWVLKPDHLDQLVVRGPASWSGPIDVALRTFHLDEDDEPRSAVIGAKAVRKDSN